MVEEHREAHASEWAVLQSVPPKLGCTTETLRRYCQVERNCRVCESPRVKSLGRFVHGSARLCYRRPRCLQVVSLNVTKTAAVVIDSGPQNTVRFGAGPLRFGSQVVARRIDVFGPFRAVMAGRIGTWVARDCHIRVSAMILFSMTPKQAYDHIAARSRRMLRLHDGLVNTRQRGIRNDWKGAFCKLMHWPQASNIDRVDSKEALIVLRAGASLSKPGFSISLWYRNPPDQFSRLDCAGSDARTPRRRVTPSG